MKLIYHQGRSKGKAFVEYRDAESAKTAVLDLNGKELDGRELNVEYVGQKPPQNFEYQDRRRPGRDHYDRDEERGRARNGRFRFDDSDRSRSRRNGRHHNPRTSKVLFVGNLSYDTNEETIEQLFESKGKIIDIRIAYNRDGESKGFAYVEFKYLEDAEDALD